MWQVLHNLAQCHAVRCRPDPEHSQAHPVGECKNMRVCLCESKSKGNAKQKHNQCESLDVEVDVDVDEDVDVDIGLNSSRGHTLRGVFKFL